jgi:hypothetical protein
LAVQEAWARVSGPATVFKGLVYGLGFGSVIFATTWLVHTVVVEVWQLPEGLAVVAQTLVAFALVYPLVRLVTLRQSSPRPGLRWPWPVPAGIALGASVLSWALVPTLLAGAPLAAAGIPYALGVVGAATLGWLQLRRHDPHAPNAGQVLARWSWIAVAAYVAVPLLLVAGRYLLLR